MVKPVILSQEANVERKNILEYWKERNQSNAYSKKLDNIFRENFKLLSTYPKIGRLLGFEELRALLVKNYLIIYKETESLIQIISIWDTRQNPERLEEKIRK